MKGMSACMHLVFHHKTVNIKESFHPRSGLHCVTTLGFRSLDVERFLNLWISLNFSLNSFKSKGKPFFSPYCVHDSVSYILCLYWLQHWSCITFIFSEIFKPKTSLFYGCPITSDRIYVDVLCIILFPAIQQDTVGIFGNLGTSARIYNKVLWIWTKLGCTAMTNPPMEAARLKRINWCNITRSKLYVLAAVVPTQHTLHIFSSCDLPTHLDSTHREKVLQ